MFNENEHKITGIVYIHLFDIFTASYVLSEAKTKKNKRKKKQKKKNYSIAITSREHIIQLRSQPRTFGIDSVRQVIAALRRR